MTWDELENSIRQAINVEVDNATDELLIDFKLEEPVDTGRSRNAWHKVTIPTLDGISYQVINDATSDKGFHYPQLLFNGSSKQLPLGHWPTFDSWLIGLNQRLTQINI